MDGCMCCEGGWMGACVVREDGMRGMCCEGGWDGCGCFSIILYN